MSSSNMHTTSKRTMAWTSLWYGRCPSEDAWKYERLQGLELLLSMPRGNGTSMLPLRWGNGLRALLARRGPLRVLRPKHGGPVLPFGDVHRLLAAATQNLPVSFITEARWIALLLRELNQSAHVFLVRNGVAKDVFPTPNALSISRTEPLRILIEGHPGVWFKGIDDALAAVDEMREPAATTVVSPVPWKFDRDSARNLGPITPGELSAIYAENDVVLKLSRVEGMFGPPLEGFHRGATCVVTPVTGHEEYVVHGWNGLVADWDDISGTGRRLDILARDRRLLHFLRLNALATARSWPSWQQSTQFMAVALRRISALPAIRRKGRAAPTARSERRGARRRGYARLRAKARCRHGKDASFRATPGARPPKPPAPRA